MNATSLVKEIPSKRHGRPTIKDGAVLLFDHKTNRIYVYGGVPWDGNPDRDSPTRQASSSFHALEISKGMLWMDYSNSLFYNSLPSRAPFAFLGDYEEIAESNLSLDPGLPCLYGASGLLVDDKTSHNRFIIIFGVDKNKAHMSLFCVNITMQKWMYLTLQGEEKKMLRFGSQIALSGVGTDNIFLHVFGGRSSDGHYLHDYLVADLKAKRWLSSPSIPEGIMPLGCSPSALSIKSIPGHEGKIILLKRREKNVVASSTNALIMDAISSEFYIPDVGEPIPPAMNTFIMHSIPDSISTTVNKWSLIGWTASDEIDNSAYADVSYDMRYRASLDIQIWQLFVELYDHTVETRDSPLSLENENSYISRQTAKKSQPFSRTRVERDAETYSSPFVLTWQKLSVGPVATALRQLDEAFAVEYAVWLDGDRLDIDALRKLGMDEPFGPSILLLGYLPAFAGEVKARCYNAFALIFLDQDDIETIDEDEYMSQSSMRSASEESAIQVPRGRTLQEESGEEDVMSPVPELQEHDRISADTLVGSSSAVVNATIEKDGAHLNAEHTKNVWSVESSLGTSPLDPDALVNGLHPSVENAVLQHGAMYSTTDYGEMDLDDKEESDLPVAETDSYPL